MEKTYLERGLDPEFVRILTQPPAYLGAWSSEKIIKKSGETSSSR